MKVARKIITIDEEKCDGCGHCVPACAEGALRIVNGKARLVNDTFCDGLGACLGDCPRGAISMIEREAEAFDEKSAHRAAAHLGNGMVETSAMPCGCPSSMIEIFDRPDYPQNTGGKKLPAESPSALSHWPVQIRLVPPTAPFLRNADLLVTADCVPFAYGSFHEDFLKGTAVLVGCPKFDDVQTCVNALTSIFEQASVRSITVVVMEVPCCQGLPKIVERALEQSGKKIPLRKVTISRQGKMMEDTDRACCQMAH
ncbi:MAG: 4Fe-4S binding protein [Deltaproteobacteria bacterium]|nr:4Fe-4S binding protein [Deltaproteobacteria bacterium]